MFRMIGSSEYSTRAATLGMTPSPNSGISKPTLIADMNQLVNILERRSLFLTDCSRIKTRRLPQPPPGAILAVHVIERDLGLVKKRRQ